jgi:drug/metabolite transporter, DME family
MNHIAHDAGEQEGIARAQLVGILFVVGAATLWSLNGALIKLTNQEGVHGVTIAFYRSLIAGLFLLPLARGRFESLRPRAGTSSPEAAQIRENTHHIQVHSQAAPNGALSLFGLLRPAATSCVLFFTLMTVCFVMANTMTEAANVIFLQYTSTFWIFALSPWLLKETPRRSDMWILVLAMVGVAVIFAGNAGGTLAGLVVALASGLFYALLTLMIRQMRDSNPAAVTVVNNLGSALLLLVPALLVGNMMLTPRGWVLVSIMGVVQFGLPYYLYTLGLARIPAYRVALITLLEPVLVPIWTYLAVKEPVPGETVVGGAVIFVALLILIRMSGRAHRVVAAETACDRETQGGGA